MSPPYIGNQPLQASQRYVDKPLGSSMDAIVNQLALAGYVLPPITRPAPAPDVRFVDNVTFWRTALAPSRTSGAGVLRPEKVVRLDRFLLLEWFPQTPGLYHTDGAEQTRMRAFGQKIQMPDGTEAYDVHGKQSMIAGGVASVRLSAVSINNTDHYFMSASSSGASHEGVPIALPPILYDRYIDEIRTRGALACHLSGRLKSVPAPLATSYGKKIPRLYLSVEEIEPLGQVASTLVVGVATTFAGEWRGEEGVFSTYATFDPADAGALDDAVRWIEEDYVGAAHRGRVLTDFDQEYSHFADAPFSLITVMKLRAGSSRNRTRMDAIGHGLADRLGQALSLENKLIVQLEVANMDARTYNLTATGENNTLTVATDGGIANVKITRRENARAAALVAQIGRLVEELQEQIQGEHVEALERHSRTLQEAQKKADRRWYSVSLEGLTEAAAAVGALAKPIADAVAQLRPLLGM